MVPVRFLYSTYLSPKKLMRNFSSPVNFFFLVSDVFIYTCEPEVRREADGGFLSFFFLVFSFLFLFFLFSKEAKNLP